MYENLPSSREEEGKKIEHNLFKPHSFEEGRHSVTGNCNEIPMQERYEKETPVFAENILALTTGKRILDYGCGVGRLSKEILAQAKEDVLVVGIDSSDQMLKLARENVNNSRFVPLFPCELETYQEKFDTIFCVYVLQHIPAIEIREALWRIYTHLKDDSIFIYCSSDYRMAVRYDNGGFFDDRFLGVNLQEEISRFFTYERELFTDEILEKNPIVKTMISGSLPHPAKIYRKKPNVNFLNISSQQEEIKIEVKEKPTSEANKLLLINRLAPGDILVMTNAIRDLHKAYPNRFKTDVRTPCNELFDNNPYITKLSYDETKYKQIEKKLHSGKEDGKYEWLEDILVIDMQYPLINKSGEVGSHFSEGHREFLESVLRLKIPQTSLTPELYLSQTERDWANPLAVKKEFDGKYWVINAGSKGDYTLKQYPYYQEVVDLLKNNIQFVQIGEKHHNHVILNNVINMVGQTNIRELIRLIYKAEGVLTCVSLQMHIAAAFRKPCVVVAGAREGTRWELYPNHQFLYVNGCLPCATYDGCWKSKHSECKNKEGEVPRCMLLITPQDVARAINRYYEGAMLSY